MSEWKLRLVVKVLRNRSLIPKCDSLQVSSTLVPFPVLVHLDLFLPPNCAALFVLFLYPPMI